MCTCGLKVYHFDMFILVVYVVEKIYRFEGGYRGVWLQSTAVSTSYGIADYSVFWLTMSYEFSRFNFWLLQATNAQNESITVYEKCITPPQIWIGFAYAEGCIRPANLFVDFVGVLSTIFGLRYSNRVKAGVPFVNFDFLMKTLLSTL